MWVWVVWYVGMVVSADQGWPHAILLDILARLLFSHALLQELSQ